MRLRPGILVCLLAGCASQSGRDESPGTAARAEARAQALAAIATGNVPCLGVEFLPPVAPEDSLAVAPLPPRAEALPPPVSVAPPTGDRDGRRLYTPTGEKPHIWSMTADDLAHQRDAAATATMHFIDDVMGEDRRRVRRQFGLPILTMQAIDLQSPGIDLRSEELRAEQEQQWMAENGASLLRRPVQLFLRRLPLVEAFDARIDDFKSDNVPLSDEYERAHQQRSKLGRVSMRVHPSDFGDPVEIVYSKSGVRIGSSREHLKMSVSRELWPGVTASVRTRQIYESNDWVVRADIAWQLSPRSTLLLAAGRDLDFASDSTVYSWVESPLDGAMGILLYATHIF